MTYIVWELKWTEISEIKYTTSKLRRIMCHIVIEVLIFWWDFFIEVVESTLTRPVSVNRASTF